MKVSLLYHNGSSSLVNVKNSGNIKNSIISKINSNSSAKVIDRPNIVLIGIINKGIRDNKDVVFLEVLLWY